MPQNAQNQNQNDQTKQPVRYCLYARKSMEPEERQAMSIEQQLKEMRVIASRDQLDVVVIKTEAHSAKDSGQREVFNQIIQEIASGKYNAILTWNPDRLSRNAGDLGKLVDLMDQERLVEIRTYNQKFTNSPNDKFLLMILGSQAKLENDNRGINVKRGLRTLFERGLWSGVAPLGYLNSNLKNQTGQMIIDQDRAPIIKQVFEKVAYDKWSGYDVLDWLREINFTSRSGRPVYLSTVYGILRRPAYFGQFERPKGSGNWYKGSHQPIIDKKLFDLVQQRLGSRAFPRKYKTKPFAFLRLMRCGLCGSGITAEEKYKKLKNGGLSKYVYYMCTKGRDRRCKLLYVNEKDLIVQLLDILDKVELDQIGMRERLEWEINRFYELMSFVSGQPMPERPAEKQAYDLRKYAQCMLEDGTPEEKREILKNLKSRLVIKDKKVYLDTELEL